MLEEGVWRADQIADIVIQSDGVAARRATTVMEVFQKTVQRRGEGRALSFKKNGAWASYTWKQYYQNCMFFAKALIKLGVEAHDCVGVIGHNSPEWFFTNIGTIAAGAIIAGIYTTNGPEACQYIVGHCDAKVVVVENKAHLNKFIQIAPQLPALKALVMWDGDVPTDVDCGVPIYSFRDFLTLGESVDSALVDARIAAQLPGHCCTLIYTSGTTGPPKAVMISHDNFTWTSHCVLDMLTDVSESERSVSFLPLSHVAAQLLDIHVPMHLGSEMYFAGPEALKGALVDILRDVRPTYFFGVPRVWEKVMEKMREIGAKTTGVKKSLATWAKKEGAEKTERAQFGADGGKSLSFRIADKVVLSKIKEALGLDQCRYCFTGAAPISAEVISFFGSLDIPIYEIFGQSECTGPHSINLPGKWKIGSIGNPLPGTKTRINPHTGEIQYAGRHIFMGYLNNEAATKETLQNGWLLSGDVGAFDDDGFLRITGRIKELIITAGGENVPPVLIEDSLASELEALSNIMVIGDKRKFLTFVCTFRVVMDEDGAPTNQLDRTALKVGKEIGSTATTVEEAIACEKFQKYIADGMKRSNDASTSRAQRVQKFLVLKKDFSIPGGELTPTLKLKRSVVAKMYADEIDSMYAE
jgi:long-chain-fatty-acid--CoA ligase ACSBG